MSHERHDSRPATLGPSHNAGKIVSRETFCVACRTRRSLQALPPRSEPEGEPCGNAPPRRITFLCWRATATGWVVRRRRVHQDAAALEGLRRLDDLQTLPTAPRLFTETMVAYDYDY